MVFFCVSIFQKLLAVRQGPTEVFKVTEHSFDENCKTSPIETNFAEDGVLLSDLPFMSKSL